MSSREQSAASIFPSVPNITNDTERVSQPQAHFSPNLPNAEVNNFLAISRSRSEVILAMPVLSISAYSLLLLTMTNLRSAPSILAYR